MNNPFSTLIQCIALLFLNRKYPVNNERVIKTVEHTLKNVKLPTSLIGDNSDGNIAVNLRHVTEWMLKSGPDVQFDKKDIITRVRLNVLKDSHYIKELEEALEDDEDEVVSIKKIHAIVSNLNYEYNQQKVRSLISRMNQKINYSSEYVDYKEALRELQEDLVKYTANAPDEEHIGYIGRVSTDDTGDMEAVFSKAKETNSNEGVLRTGYVGLNRMAGGLGLHRGEMINIGALTHHYKSGMLLDLTRQIPLYNKPWMWDEAKKPLVLRVSFENKLDQDLPILYKGLVEQETKQGITVSEIDPNTAASYVKKRLGENGYSVAIECYDPNNFSIYDLIDLVQGYEAKGYEIHLLVVDYLELIARASEKDLRGDEAINSCFEMLRNHCFGRGITVVTGHQLSTEAQQLAREGSPNFVKMVAEGGWYRNSRSLHTKLDLEILCHIHKVGDVSYLTVARGKHRGGEGTPIKHRFYFQPFHPVGGLWDDIEMDVPECHHGSITEYINEMAVSDSASGDEW